MLSLKTWRTVAAALLLVVLATTATATAAGTTTPAHPQAHYCKQVDAYRLKTCARPSSLTRRWAASWAGC